MRGDLEWGSVPGVMRSAVERFGDREGIVDGDLRLSFAELADAGRRAAEALVASGIAKGDRVSIWAPNIAEWVVALLGIHGAGAAAVPLNTRFKGDEAAYIIGKSRARMAFTVGVLRCARSHHRGDAGPSHLGRPPFRRNLTGRQICY